MTELTGLTVWGETVKKVKTVRTKNIAEQFSHNLLCSADKSFRRGWQNEIARGFNPALYIVAI